MKILLTAMKETLSYICSHLKNLIHTYNEKDITVINHHAALIGVM